MNRWIVGYGRSPERRRHSCPSELRSKLHSALVRGDDVPFNLRVNAFVPYCLDASLLHVIHRNNKITTTATKMAIIAWEADDTHTGLGAFGVRIYLRGVFSPPAQGLFGTGDFTGMKFRARRRTRYGRFFPCKFGSILHAVLDRSANREVRARTVQATRNVVMKGHEKAFEPCVMLNRSHFFKRFNGSEALG